MIGPFNIDQILQILPHRYPFLMIDRVVELEEDKKVICLKNISQDEPFFQGHFPNKPIMPGVLIIEAMAQAAIILFSGGVVASKEKTYYLASADVKFMSPVYPGEQLIIEIIPIKITSNAGIVEGKCTVSDKVVAKGKLSFSVK